jgi:hypothetical protein
VFYVYYMCLMASGSTASDKTQRIVYVAMCTRNKCAV